MTVSVIDRRVWMTAIGLLAATAVGFSLARLTSTTSTAATAARSADAADSIPRTNLEMDESYLTAVGIGLEVVTPGNLSAEVRAPGSVAATPDGQAMVSAHAPGTVVRIIKQLGDTVRAGETLAWVESREGVAIAADRDVANAKVALARSVTQREQRLFEQHVTPRQDLEAAQAQLLAAEAEARRAHAAAADAHVSTDGRVVQVVSPLSGRITATSASLGVFVQADTELFRVADPAHIQIEAAVTAADAVRISAGDRAIISSGAGAVYAASVRSVTPTVNEQTRSATVLLSFSDTENGKPGLPRSPAQQGVSTREVPAPGEFVLAIITPKSVSPAGFVVPEDAIQHVDGRDVVFVRSQTGFKVRPVALGPSSGGRALVVSGLSAGDRIATRNAFFLKAELGKGAGEDEE